MPILQKNITIKNFTTLMALRKNQRKTTRAIGDQGCDSHRILGKPGKAKKLS